MKFSFSLVISTIFVIYIAYSMFTFSQIFRTLECSDKRNCFANFLNRRPKMQLALFSSTLTNPISTEVKKLLAVRNFDYSEPYQRNIKLDVPLKTRRNGTLFMYVVLALDDGKEMEWKEFQRDGPVVIQRVHLTKYMVPKDAVFNLLESQKTDESTPKKKVVEPKPKTHVKNKVFITVLTDQASLSPEDVTPELARMARLTKNKEFLPMLQNNVLKDRSVYLVEVNRNITEIDLEFNYSPSSVGKFRLIALIEASLKQLTSLGFSSKDLDEVKEIFAETNLYLLLGTIFIGSIHTLFDFLSFKNDVNFWRKKKNYAGLSTRSTLWRAFSSIIIFMYLFDEKSSMLILIPSGIGALIELWKCKRILKLELTWKGFKKIETVKEEIAKAEQETQEFDKQGMKYLSFVLYPLVVGYAIYSLLYHPHKSWYSWTLNSTVNGVYAFGFLFMCPQLFINYKLKSVASLPWRAFMYKAFNTFIDDIFAFIITMPTAHRLACFRDDVIFLIYLYQRWLYPVDKTRIDAGASMDEQEEYEAIDTNEKETKKTK